MKKDNKINFSLAFMMIASVCFLVHSQIPPKYYNHGSFSGFLTYAEIVRELDEMKMQYPKLVSAKLEVGKSVEGRSIWAVRVSNNPDVEQANKTKIVYNTLTDTRMPLGMMSMMWFLWHLLENSETDAKIKKIIDSLVIYYIPAVNPDGWVYNHNSNVINTKNRSRNSDGSRGVNINRNYSVNWGGSGSSLTPISSTYRGPEAFSEPETRAIRDFYLAKKFKITSTISCCGKLIFHPYSSNTRYPTNRSQYEALLKAMTRTNGWRFGLMAN